MKAVHALKVAIAAVVTVILSASALSTAATGTPAPAITRNVIVILRDQMPTLPAVRGQREARAAALASAQTPIVSHLQSSGATRIRGFALINAVTANVSAAEEQALAAHPLVQAVVPEVVIKLPHPTSSPSPKARANSNLASAGGGSGAPLCNTLEPEALQLTNTAFLDPGVPQAQRVRDGNGQFVIGKGVKVAWIADGIDPTVQGFIHTDGTPVFIDYQNFSGDPAGTPTAGGEAFGDASSIAAQDTPHGKLLTFDISQYVDTALGTLPSSPCNIRIRGMAPGASLVGLKVFSNLGYTTNTSIVQAIDYAVVHDDVDVINESFGGNPFPDNDNDPISLADQAAVRGGVTVVVSTGDAGYNGTMGTPSTDPYVISAGATTQLRLYTQAGYGPAFFATHGWLSNNISAFSSGGFSMSGPRVPDVVAPGDLGWALCAPLTELTLFTDCGAPLGGQAAPPAIQIFGGTSESSPLTAGEAALIIQAYRSTHHGRDPSPALVKTIIMSTASDLGAPPTEQGAGLINALAAVNAALSVSDQNGGKESGGSSVLYSPTNASITDQTRAPESVTVAITNTGSVKQLLEPSLQALGPPIAGATTSVTLSASSPVYPSPGGLPRYYALQKFNVPAGAQHLDAAIAWQAPFFGPAVIAEFGLIDPSGKDAGYTIPQGASSGYGHFDVNHPAPGTWTAVIWTSGVDQTYFGPVQFSWTAERYVSFGSVSPASFELAPGATQWVTARFSMPVQPGDKGVAIRFAPAAGGAQPAEIPIALRALITTGPNGGFFNGTLTGGNGRDATGPTQTYAFDVPAGVNNMNLSLQVSDSLYLLQGLLIAPDGMQLSVQPNVDAAGNTAFAMQLNRANPVPGQWRFILLQNYYISGNQTSLPFTAQVNFNAAQVTATGLPNNPNTKLSVGAGAVTVPITITNTGGLAQAYFADARLEALTTLTFGTSPVCAAAALPGGCWATLLPTQVQSAQFIARAGAPITMEALGDTGYILGFTGAPDLTARSAGPNTMVASITESEVPWGEWVMYPTLQGPFGASGAPTTAVTTSVVAQLKAFDATVSADSGDLWSDVVFGTATYNPLVLGAGATGTIQVTLTPSASQVGTTVHGFIYIDTFNSTVQTGDEVVRLPYSYTVVR
jgi:subtilase family protein